MNGTQGVGVPGIAGVLRLATLMKTVKGESAKPDDLRYKWEYRIIKVGRRKSRDWPQHRHGSPECRESRGEERTVGVTDRLCVEA